MRRNHLAWCLACALAALALPEARAQNKSGDDTKVSRCVDYQQKTRDSSLEVRLESSCSIDLECGVTWELKCEGKAPSSHGKAFPLLAGDVAAVEASADACGDAGWAVRKVRWSCKTASDD